MKVLIVSILVVAILLLATGIGLTIKTRAKPNNKKVVIKSSHKDFLYNSYVFFNKYTVSSKYLQRIRKRVEIIDVVDTWTLYRRTMKISYISISVAIIALIVMILLSDSLYFMLLSIVIVYVIHEEILDSLLTRSDNKLLEQLEKSIGDIRHMYHQSADVEDALFDAASECDYEVSQHINEMYNVLTSEDVDANISNYYEKAPNKFFKILLSQCHTIIRYGDKKVNGQSMFLTNLGYLKDEINEELLQRKEMARLFSALVAITIFPIFTVKAIAMWGTGLIPELEALYRGAYGFLLDVILFIIEIAGYKAIKKMKSPYNDLRYSSFIEQQILKLSMIKKVIRERINKKYTHALKIQSLLKTTGTKVSVEHFYVKNFTYAAIGTFITLVVIINMNFMSRNNILSLDNQIENYKESYTTYSLDELKGEQDAIIKYKKNKNLTYDMLEEELRNSGVKEENLAQMTNEAMEKLEKYRNIYFKWYHLLISIVIGILTYQIPYLMLLFRKKIIEMAMGEEVFQFQTILLMLSNIDRITTNEILEQLELFADIFKDSISKCIMNFEADEKQALEDLKFDENYTPFVRIIENLEVAERIGIKEAFDTLTSDRLYYTEQRKQNNKFMIQNKSIIGKAIAYMPIIFVIVFYLTGPFVIGSVNSMQEYNTQAENFL